MDTEPIRAGYDHMWAVGKVDLAKGIIDVDPVPDASTKRWGISAILRLPLTFGKGLQPLIDTLTSLTSPGHTVYDPTTLHITLRSIEFFRDDISESDPALTTYSRLLRELAPSFSGLGLQFAGLSANRVGVILQGYPVDGELQYLRQQFHHRLAEAGLHQGPEQQSPRLNAHASLVVFGGPLGNASALVEYVANNRRTSYGQIEVTGVDLVRYHRGERSIRIETLERISFG